MKCPECGAFVKSGVEKCPKCGHGLPNTKTEGPMKGAASGKTTGSAGAPKGEPPSKGSAIASKKGMPGAKGRSKIVDMRSSGKGPGGFPPTPGPQQFDGTQAPKRSMKPMIAGILLFVCAVDTVLYGILLLTMIDKATLETMGYSGDTLDLALATVKGLGYYMLVIGLVAIIPGIFAILRKKWGLCLGFSIVSILTVGMAFTSSILAIVAMILIILSRKEFAGMNDENKLPEPELRR